MPLVTRFHPNYCTSKVLLADPNTATSSPKIRPLPKKCLKMLVLPIKILTLVYRTE
jgi:hypothetical protein